MGLPTETKLLIGMVLTECIQTALLFLRVKARRDYYRYKATTFPHILENLFIILAWLGGIVIVAFQIWTVAVANRYRDQAETWPVEHPDEEWVVNLNMPAHPEAVVGMRLGFVSDLLYVWILWNCKACFLVVQYDLCRAFPRWHMILLWTATAYMAVSFCINFFMSLPYCKHNLSSLVSYKEDYCSALNDNRYVKLAYALNIGGDAFIIISYVALINRLRLRGPSFYAFTFIILLGLITMMASTISFVHLLQLNNDVFSEFADAQESMVEDLEQWTVWSYVEWSVAFVTACLPALRSFVRDKVERSAGSNGSGDFGTFSSGFKKGLSYISSRRGTRAEKSITTGTGTEPGTGTGREKGFHMVENPVHSHPHPHSMEKPPSQRSFV